MTSSLRAAAGGEVAAPPMCLIVIAFQSSPRFPLVIAANRDEAHARPTAPADFWAETPDILAGRDLLAGGSWLGINRNGRLAAVTNVRETHSAAYRHSRGALVGRFLGTGEPLPGPPAEHSLTDYGPFNLLTGSVGGGLSFVTNRGGHRALGPGLHGLSNGSFDSLWPKVERSKRALADWLHREDDPEVLFQLLADTRPARQPPDTGLGQALERALSAPFIVGERYGTRCSTCVLVDDTGRCQFWERRFNSGGAEVGFSRFQFQLRP